MNKKVSEETQDGNALDQTITRNIADLQKKGFDTEDQTTLQSCIEDTVEKERAQNVADKDLNDKTAEQNAAVQETTTLIKKVRNAALTGYSTDKRTLALFNAGINKKLPDSVNGVRTECVYLNTVIPGRETVLLKSGLQQEDITLVINAPARIVAIDKSQEDAKKIREAATLARDLSVKALKAIKKKIRNFVKTAFADNSVMLVQFEPIPKGRGGSSTPPPEDPPTPPAQ